MDKWQKYSKQREEIIAELEGQLKKKIAKLQGWLYGRVINVIDGLDTDNGKIKRTISNYTKSRKVSLLIEQLNTASRKELLLWLISSLLDLFDVNRRYFASIKDYNFATVDFKALQLTMLQYGYDAKAKEIIPDGWLTSLTGHEKVKQDIIVRINQAIAGGTGLKEFRKQFRDDFTGKNGLGVLDRYYNQTTGDLFMNHDRAVGLVYANELGLNHAVYSGTVVKDSRPFCVARNNHVYTRAEIESWQSKEWAGKAKGSVLVHLGGYRCRHSLNWITEGMAKQMGKINTYG